MSNETEPQQLSPEGAAAADAAADSQPMSSDPHVPGAMSAQTESELEVEIDDLNKLLVTREEDLRKYVKLLQRELEKRSNDAVVSAAAFRTVLSQLAAIDPSKTAQPQPLQQKQQEGRMGYKSEIFLFLTLFLYRWTTAIWFI